MIPKRAKREALKVKFIDLHCDTISEIYKRRRKGETYCLLENGGHVDLKRLKEGGCLAQSFALFTRLKDEEDPLKYARNLLSVFREEVEKNREVIRQVTSVDEILENERKGRMSAVLTVEEGGVFQGRIQYLEEFWRQGLKMVTLTWNYPNELGYPNLIDWKTGKCRPETERGLTSVGIEFVERMEELGIAVDVSHLGDAGFWDVARVSRKPFAASHSNARAIASHVRNLTDDMIRELGSRGGIIGINYCPAFLDDRQALSQSGGVSRLSDIVRHICHIRNVGGIDCIALGSDFDGIEGELEINSPASLGLLESALTEQGFTGEEREKIFRKNAERFFYDVWGKQPDKKL